MHHAALVQYHRTVADGQNRLRMLLHDDGRQPFVAGDAGNGAQQLFHNDGGQAFQGFVQQQQARVQHQGPAHSQHLLLAARQLRAQIGFALGQAREHLVHPLRRPRWCAAPCTPGTRHGRQVFVHRERFENIALLRHPANAGTRARLRRQGMQWHAGQHDLTRVLAGSTRQRVHQGGFTGAVAPQERQGFAFGQRKTHTVEHHGFAVARAQIGHLQ